ncbi:LacI family DNA-binding transcriptional regulator [Protaetiibacter mangrovi]|uniref:LacI family transcriptional regulator n=1 Tax=Protaetiibacter mangrovi TaxID=2970926 RepID=A0ABT1ZGP3_9MICO|nr:LacI family DNA-binding transcriptional regulator [Protaetiibacter mangrovi]MCS0499889.1 LacI family transcriptional regulator [Protaetiibacter mangrovi]TPW91277.1 LacI family transcriptional regulator [Schumannella luteola]
MTERVTLAQIAEATGFSVMTVSNVLNDRPGASDSTRKKVAKAAAQLGYIPSSAARNLKGGRTGLVGIIADVTNPYGLEIVRGVMDELESSDLELLISSNHNDRGREYERVDFLTRGFVDALVLMVPALEQPTIDLLVERRRPVVIVDPRRFDIDLPRIVVDNYGGMRQATQHLLDLGHTEIGYLSGVWEFESSRERFSGFEDAMRLAGLTVPPELKAICEFNYASGFQNAQKMISASHPTAIVCGADTLAMGAIDAVRSLGMSVPQDVSVVGFDDLPQASHSYPGLTTVRQPLHDMGQLAARSVASQLNGTGPLMERMLFNTTLIVRGSTAAPRGGDSTALDAAVSFSE